MVVSDAMVLDYFSEFIDGFNSLIPRLRYSISSSDKPFDLRWNIHSIEVLQESLQKPFSQMYGDLFSYRSVTNPITGESYGKRWIAPSLLSFWGDFRFLVEAARDFGNEAITYAYGLGTVPQKNILDLVSEEDFSGKSMLLRRGISVIKKPCQNVEERLKTYAGQLEQVRNDSLVFSI